MKEKCVTCGREYDQTDKKCRYKHQQKYKCPLPEVKMGPKITKTIEEKKESKKEWNANLYRRKTTSQAKQEIKDMNVPITEAKMMTEDVFLGEIKS